MMRAPASVMHAATMPRGLDVRHRDRCPWSARQSWRAATGYMSRRERCLPR